MAINYIITDFRDLLGSEIIWWIKSGRFWNDSFLTITSFVGIFLYPDFFCDEVFLLLKCQYTLINQTIISKSPSTSPSTLLTLRSPHLTSFPLTRPFPSFARLPVAFPVAFPHRHGERDTRVLASHENNVNLSPQAWGEGHLTDQASGTGMP